MNLYSKIIDLYNLRVSVDARLNEENKNETRISLGKSERKHDSEKSLKNKVEMKILEEPRKFSDEKLFREDIFISNLLKQIASRGLYNVEEVEINQFISNERLF